MPLSMDDLELAIHNAIKDARVAREEQEARARAEAEQRNQKAIANLARYIAEVVGPYTEPLNILYSCQAGNPEAEFEYKDTHFRLYRRDSIRNDGLIMRVQGFKEPLHITKPEQFLIALGHFSAKADRVLNVDVPE